MTDQITLESWRGRAKTKLQQLKSYLAKAPDGLPAATYTTLCGLTLWPLAAAAANGGPPAFSAAYTLASDIGVNLVAGLIEQWYIRSRQGESEPLTEHQFVISLSEQMQSSKDEWVAELRQVLDEVDALQAADTHLSDDIAKQVYEALREDLQTLGDYKPVRALGEKAVALGERAIYLTGTTVEGSVISGNQNTVNDQRGATVHNYYGSPADAEAQQRKEALRRRYLRHIVKSQNRLALSGIATTLQRDELHLNAVYTALITADHEADDEGEDPRKREQAVAREMGRERPHISALAQINKHQHFVLLGAPGSGKSTFVNFVAACMAGELLQQNGAENKDDEIEAVNLETLQTPLPDQPLQRWSHRPLIPMTITLRDLAASGILPEKGEIATVKHFWEYMIQQLNRLGLEEFVQPLKDELGQQGGLLLFDGLDEVPTADDHREQIKQLVESVAQQYEACHILVTSRTYAYQDEDWRLRDFPVAELLPFTEGQINHFIDCWYQYVAAESQGMDRETAKGRANQLKETIADNKRLQALAEQPLLLTLMASLHFSRGGTLPEKLDGLIKQEKLVVYPTQILNYLSQRAGLLVSHKNYVYQFPHRTFQEYLAAVHLTNVNYPYDMAELARRDVNRWREVALLAGAKAARGATSTVWQLVEVLCEEPNGELNEPQTAPLWGALLAGQLLVETNLSQEPRHRTEQKKLDVAKQLLIATMTSDDMPLTERALAGRLLSQLGDPRKGVGVRDDGLPDIAWGGEVSAGTYMIGGDSAAFQSFDEQQITIEKPYQLSRYPVTYAQFQCFVEAEDYDDPRWWEGMPEKDKDWRGDEYVTKEMSEQYFKHANHPREMVAWYQAVAFCRWLTDKLGFEVTLPHEYQWEVAARHPDGQKYPWGDEFVETLANTDESNLNTTAAVGMYPQGQNKELSLYGLSGNVWEWCLNKWDDPEDTAVDESSDVRVLRGGSWLPHRNFARAASRASTPPQDRNDGYGFRLCRACPPSRALVTGSSGER